MRIPNNGTYFEPTAGRCGSGGGRTLNARRAEQANGGSLLVLAVLIVYEAIHRLVSPPDVSSWTVVIVALAGVAVNLLATGN
jgi:cobalt-zinc-cadmium efflux system protein